MANNKIVANGITLIDLSSATVTAATLESGYTAYDKSGAKITGTMTGYESQGSTEDTTASVNKVVKSDGTVILDISGVTVTENHLAEGIKAFNKRGTLITGTMKKPSGIKLVVGSTTYNLTAAGSVDGVYNYYVDGNNWVLVILTNCTITMPADKRSIDAFLVGGGQGGTGSSYRYTGYGGYGGYRYTKSAISLSDSSYNVVIGTGGNGGARSTSTSGSGTTGTAGGNTTAFSYSSASGSRSTRGARATNTTNTNGGAGSDGVYPFGATAADNSYPEGKIKYGAAGGGGGHYYYQNANTYYIGQPGKGGTTGGGNGGTKYNPTSNAEAAGLPGTERGAGGGGGSFTYYTSSSSNRFSGAGGKGADGVLIIRNAR